MLRFDVRGDRLTAEVDAEVRRHLTGGAVIAYPTETLYGLGCDPRNDAAVQRLVRLKGRPGGKPLPLIAASADAARAAVTLIETIVLRRWDTLTSSLWPGPLTLVADAAPGLAPPVLAGTGSAGLRVSPRAVARRLAEICGGLIVATSANRGGGEAPATAEAVVAALGAEIDLLLDGGRAPGGAPSTVLDIRGERPRLIRPGRIPAETLTSLLGEALDR